MSGPERADERCEDLYVVRIRRDVSYETLRGCVDDVVRGERVYFTAFRDLAAFLQTRIERGRNRP